MHTFITYLSSFDPKILYAVQSIGPKWEPVFSFLSHGIGSYPIMLVVFFLALLFVDKWRVAVELLIVTGMSFIFLTIIKHYFGIARPYTMDINIIPYDTETSFALPSGHALMSLVILGWVALRHPKSHTLVWGVTALIILIGVSRVYLGVHYPSQVIAGWLFGALFIYVFNASLKRLWSPFQKNLR
jgi:membrane-associated phospholipid phosphatase